MSGPGVVFLAGQIDKTTNPERREDIPNMTPNLDTNPDKRTAKIVKKGKNYEKTTKIVMVLFLIVIGIIIFVFTSKDKYNNILNIVGGIFIALALAVVIFLKNISNSSMTLNIKKRNSSGVAVIGVSLITLELLKYLSLYYNIDTNDEKNPDKNTVYITDKNKYNLSFLMFNIIQFILLMFMVYYYLNTPVNKKVYFNIFLLYFICMMVPNFINFVSPLSKFKESLLYSIYTISSVLFVTVVILPLISYYKPNEFALNLFGQDDSIVEFNKDKNFSTSENLVNTHIKNKENLYNSINNIGIDNIEFLNNTGEILKFDKNLQDETDKNINDFENKLEESKKLETGGSKSGFRYATDAVDRLLNKGTTNVSISSLTSDTDKQMLEELIKKCEESGNRLTTSGIAASTFKDSNAVEDINVNFAKTRELKGFEDKKNKEEHEGRMPITYLGDAEKTQIKGNKKLYLTEEGEKNINFNEIKLTNTRFYVSVFFLLIFFGITIYVLSIKTKNKDTSLESVFKSINLFFPIILFLTFNFYKPIYIFILLFSIFLISSLYFYIPNVDKKKDDFEQFNFIYITYNVTCLVILILFYIFMFLHLKIRKEDKDKKLTVYEKHIRDENPDNGGQIKDYKTDENQNLFKV